MQKLMKDGSASNPSWENMGATDIRGSSESSCRFAGLVCLLLSLV